MEEFEKLFNIDCIMQKAYKQGENLIIEGYASTEDVDSVGDVVLTASARTAIEKAMIKYMSNPVVLFQHGRDKDIGYRSIGHVEDYKIDAKGLWVKVLISSADDVKPIRTRIDEKDLRAFSIGFVKKKASRVNGVNVITDIDLKEISVVSVPCNENTLFSVVKMFENEKLQEKLEMELQEKFNKLYMEFCEIKAEKSLNETEKKYLQEQLDKKAYENAEHKADMEKTIKNWESEKAELETKTAELEAKIKEYEEKGLKFKADAPSTKESEIVTKAFENAMFDIERTPYYDMEESFIRKMTEGTDTTRGKDKFVYNKEMVVKSFLEDKGVSYEPTNVKHRELVEKAIASTASINRESTVEFEPLKMADSRAPLLALIPKRKMDTKNHKWYQQTAIPTAIYESEGFTPTLTNGTYGSKNADLKIQYSGSQVNDFAEKVAGISMLAQESRAVDMALDLNTHLNIIFGDATANAKTFNGITTYLVNDSAQFTDKNGTALTLDLIDDLCGTFMELVAGSSTEGKRPTVYLCDTRAFTKIKKLLRALYVGGVIQSTMVINGFRYNMIDQDGIMFVECDDLRDYGHTAPSVVASAVAGGSLADDQRFFRVSAVTKNGESTASTEVNATTATTDNTTRLAVTVQAGDLYYRVYYGLTTGHTNLKWIQNVLVTGTVGGTQNIDITTEPSAKYEKCLDDANNSKLIALKIGGNMGLEMGFNEMKTFVKLAKTGDHERFYKRNYENAVLKNEYAVAELLCDLA